MMTFPTLAHDIVRDILCEAGPENCRIATLAAGCYGNIAYMEDSYGITAERQKRAEKDVVDTVEFIREEHGIEVSVEHVIHLWREADRAMEAAWDRVLDRVGRGLSMDRDL